jgi:hypothetical protein
MKVSCEFIEQTVADNRQGVVLHLGGWGQLPGVKIQLVRKRFTGQCMWKHGELF